MNIKLSVKENIFKLFLLFMILLFSVFTFSNKVIADTKPQIPQDKIKYYEDVLLYGTEEELQKALSELLLYDVSPLLNQLLNLLNSSVKPSIKIAIINCIRSLKDKAQLIAPSLKVIITDKYVDKNLLSITILACGELGLIEFEDNLFNIFNDKVYKDDINILKNVLIALGKMQSKKYMEQIFQFLVDSKNNSEVRSSAALYFAEFDSVDIKYIQKFNEMVIDKTENSFIRRYLLYALSKYKDQSSYEFIVKAISDDDPYIQIYAARALKEYKSSEAIPVLLNALRSNNPSVRIEVLNLLGEIKSLDTIDAIAYKIINDKDANVRKAARDAFLKIVEANKNANLTDQQKETIKNTLLYIFKYDPVEANRLKAKELLSEIFKMSV
ncbi:MAG: HEAT repeat domain-containing protein [Spirochaetota bacterium]